MNVAFGRRNSKFLVPDGMLSAIFRDKGPARNCKEGAGPEKFLLQESGCRVSGAGSPPSRAPPNQKSPSPSSGSIPLSRVEEFALIPLNSRPLGLNMTASTCSSRRNPRKLTPRKLYGPRCQCALGQRYISDRPSADLMISPVDGPYSYGIC
jgi:hypothetical protein